MPDDADLSQLDWEPCLLPVCSAPELEAYARKEVGTVPASLKVMSRCGWFGRVMVEMISPRRLLAHLDFDLADALGLVVSRDSSCRYCYAIQKTLLQVLGYDARRIAELEQLVDSEGQGGPMGAALRFARRVSRSAPLPAPHDLQELSAAGFSADEIREICVMVAATVLANRTASLVAVPPFDWERAPRRWYFPLLAPLMAILIRRKRQHARGGEWIAYSGPHDYLVEALAGLPAAHVVADALQACWDSTLLADRSKALIFAVVAHGLQCPLSLQSALAVLRSEGLPESATDRILAHLAGPELDEVETILVPFARETIWVSDPGRIQRRGRAVRDALGEDVFAEAVAFYSLANMVCRLGIVTQVGR